MTIDFQQNLLSQEKQRGGGREKQGHRVLSDPYPADKTQRKKSLVLPRPGKRGAALCGVSWLTWSWVQKPLRVRIDGEVSVHMPVVPLSGGRVVQIAAMRAMGYEVAL